jgi:nucleotide-binding universal stress UspA family protein
MEQQEPEQAPILVAFNALVDDREPVEFGVAAQRVTGASLVIVSVRDGDDDVAGTLDELRQDLERRAINAEVRVLEGGHAADVLVDAVVELRPALVVLGSARGSKLRSALHGTTKEPVIQKAGCPVAIVPRGYQPPPEGVRRIGVAYAPTHEGRSALRFAAGLARAGSSALRAILVLGPELAGADAPPEVAGLREQLASVAEDVDAEADIVFGDPAEMIIGVSEQFDLLVIGSRARGGRRAVMFGSVSREVAERSACPVVVLPGGSAEAAGEFVSHVVGQRPS